MDLEPDRPLSPTIVERAESDLVVIKTYLQDRLRPHYPKATVALVMTDNRASYLIDLRGTNRPLISYGFRAADAAVDAFIVDRPMTLAEIERTLGADTAYSGKHNAT